MNQITEPVAFLHWLRDGGLFAPLRFPAGTSREAITTWRVRVAANGGTTIEVYDPRSAPALSPEAATSAMPAQS